MTFTLKKRLKSWYSVSLLALAFAFNANAADQNYQGMDQLDQYAQSCDQIAKPKKPWKKAKKPKQCSQQDLGGHVRRHRHHRNHLTTITTTTNVNRNVQQCDSGTDSENESPCEKVASGDRDQIWQDDTVQNQQQCGRTRKRMHTNKDVSLAPVREKCERRRTHYDTTVNTDVISTVIGEEEEWTSSSEEDIAPPKVIKKGKQQL